MTSSAQPLVSVILPTHNGSKYLREAVDSCLAQTYQRWELILVDDCSTDATPMIIEEYVARDPRIRSIRHETNLKLPAALNTGHAAALGEYLGWTSDDNRFLPNALEEMVLFLEEQREVGLVYTDCVLIDEEGRRGGEYPAQPPSRLAYQNALSACFLYRRGVYEAVGAYDAAQFLAEDYDYWLRIYRQFELAPLHKVLYEYRLHEQSLTSTWKKTAVWASAERTLRRHLPHLSRSSRQERAQGWIFCATTSARRGAPLQASLAYMRALYTAPLFSMGYVARKLGERVSLLRAYIERPGRS
jgi:glycosyltransferase involved in cell wall biosynthesis